MLAGGDCIDAALRTGSTDSVLGCVVKVPSTLGTFLRSFSWGHVRQLDRVSRELLAGAWAAGAGPCDDPLTIDLDSTVCETYGLAKEGAQHRNHAGQRGYHPLLAQLRQGRANSGAGRLPLPARGGEPCALRRRHRTTHHAGRQRFLQPRIVAACRDKGVRFSITVRQHRSLRNIIEAIPEADWTPALRTNQTRTIL